MSSFHGLPCSSLRVNIHTEIFQFLTTHLAEPGPSSQPVLLQHQERALLVPTLKPAGKLFLGKQSVLPQPGNGFPFPCSMHKVSRRHRGKSFPLLPPRLQGRLTRPHPVPRHLKVLWILQLEKCLAAWRVPSARDIPHLTAQHHSLGVRVLPARVPSERYPCVWPLTSHTCPAHWAAKPHHRGMRRCETAKSHSIIPRTTLDTPC